LIPCIRNRTSFEDITYGLYLYFLGLSYRNAAKALSSRIKKRSHVAVWKWVQKYKPERIFTKRKRIFEFIIDETQLKVGNNYFWIWIAIESSDRTVLDVRISAERNMFVAERFLSSLVQEYGKHPVSTDGGTWYPQACKYLKLRHHIHSAYEKSIIERSIEYLKDRTECFDDYFPCKKQKCILKHIINWLNLFIDYHNRR
jgi:putative transposase